MLQVVLWWIFGILAFASVICVLNEFAYCGIIITAAVAAGAVLLIYYVVKQAVKDALREEKNNK